MELDSFPPELFLHLGRFLTMRSLAALSRTARRYNELLGPQLYNPKVLGFSKQKRHRGRYRYVRDSDVMYCPRWNCAKHWRSPYIVDCFQKMPLDVMAFWDHPQWTWAHVFAYVGNVHLLKVILARGVEVDATLRSGKSLLYLATVNEQLPVVYYLLKAGADMWKPDRYGSGSGPFMSAVDSRRTDLVRVFVEAVKAGNGGFKQENYEHFLIISAIHCPRILALLLANGADQFEKSNRNGFFFDGTPLHWACRHGSTESCEILIRVMKSCNMSISIPAERGDTPLHVVAQFGDCHGFICRKLVKAGADLLALNNDGLNPMDVAVLEAKKPVFEVFLKYGPSVWPSENLQNQLPSLSSRRSVFHISHFVNELVEAGKISFNWSMKDRAGLTALHYACRTALANDLEFSFSLEKIDHLLDNGADPDIPDDEEGETPLHMLLKYVGRRNMLSRSMINRVHSSINRVHSIFNRLFHACRNPAIKTRCGDTLLHYATRYGYLQLTTDFLRNLDRDTVFATNDAGDTILHTAASGEGRDRIVQQALGAGLDVSAQNENGQTALHIAAQFSRNLPAVRLLVEAGADISAFDKDGNCPLHYAAERTDNSTIAYLVEAGAASHDGCGICDERVTPWKDGTRTTNLNEDSNTSGEESNLDPFAELDVPTIWGVFFRGGMI